MPMNKSQFINEIRRRLPHIPEKELMEGVHEFAKANPKMEPEQALQALDIFLKQNPQHAATGLSKFIGENNR